MEKNTKQSKSRNTAIDRENVRVENLAKYFFDLSKLVFAALVVGGFSPLYTGTAVSVNWLIMGLGIVGTCLAAYTGNKLLKTKEE
ncbi:MAG: hypothetical protein LBN24_03180 [Mediterranea sp.]|jgi:hypothetical protein|nr:hypothetical protein [Mediterranea sp.]